jgi:hypothetical protein
MELAFFPNAELHVCHGEVELGDSEEALTARLVDKLVDAAVR